MPAPLYPWDEWFGSDRFEIVAGQHYVCSNSSMTQQIRVEANRRGLFVTVQDKIGHLVVHVSRTPWRVKEGVNK